MPEAKQLEEVSEKEWDEQVNTELAFFRAYIAPRILKGEDVNALALAAAIASGAGQVWVQVAEHGGLDVKEFVLDMATQACNCAQAFARMTPEERAASERMWRG